MEDTQKKDRLKAVVLLLIGFIVGFASHAFTVNTEDSASTTKNEETLSEDGAEKTDENVVVDEDVKIENTKPVVEEESTSNVSTNNNAVVEGYTFSVADQTSGDSVQVSQVSFEKKAWIAVRDDMNGTMGNILGAYLYQEGVVQNNPIDGLLRATKPASSYYAVVYIDDGDMLFDFKKDTLLVDAQGTVVSKQFKTF